MASHVQNYRTKITAKILGDDGVVLSEGVDVDSWQDSGGAESRRASAGEATSRPSAGSSNCSPARDVAEKSGLA